ncbi:addiction module protein [Myxococcota bacterium]|nr:addiction module protein [Myxococcota bacterium]MBU1379323.1 addiction module protein [Myxococcota bacterium]MBU1497002.1 addiction module protein [Myxococcota bacterium]
MKTEDLIAEALSLPIELRTQLADKLLKSLNPGRKEIDDLWAEEAEKRVEEIRTGKVTTIEGEKVFRKIHSRLSK